MSAISDGSFFLLFLPCVASRLAARLSVAVEGEALRRLTHSLARRRSNVVAVLCSFFFLAHLSLAGKDEYDLAEFAAYDEENVDEGAGAASNKDKKESEK